MNVKLPEIHIKRFSQYKAAVNENKLKDSFEKFKENFPNNQEFYAECAQLINEYDNLIEKEIIEQYQIKNRNEVCLHFSADYPYCFDRDDPRGIPYFIADRFAWQTDEEEREELTLEDLDIIERFLNTPAGKEGEAWDWFLPWVKRGWPKSEQELT